MDDKSLEKEGYTAAPLSAFPSHIDTTNNALTVPLPAKDSESKASGPSAKEKRVEPLNSTDFSERGHALRRY